MILGKITQWTVVLLGITRRTNNRGGRKTFTSAGLTNINQLFQFKSWNFVRTMASGSTPKHKNRLADEKSPYLLQHAHNPVQWYPWSEEAFEIARRESKVIFLSVGYSTCHWCHVMERESFENEEIAKLMNEYFINIKVDREERPDVDKIYMTFVQATTGGGGWPMSVWLTPDLTPIYGGTYFPPDDRYYGRPGFKSVLNIIHSQWSDNQSKFSETGMKVLEALKKGTYLDPTSSPIPQLSAVNKCLQQLAQSFEPKFGGFGEAPKFPQPVNLNFLFHAYPRDPKSEMGKKALEMALFTLKMMAKGGIHDHVSQGFARYSTDEKWHVPHFEKMLYDQAQLAVAYSNAFIASKDEFFADVVRDILMYVDRDLGHELGGFYSAEDADSYPDHNSTHKREGAFCVWTFDDIKRLLEKPVDTQPDLTYSDVFCHHYSVREEGNVNPYQDPHDELKGQNVLIVFGSEEETAAHFNITLEKTKAVLKESCEILFAERLKRPRPHLDDKILTAWNGLMISGFSKASQALQDDEYLQRAVKAANFIKQYLYNPTSKMLLRSCYRGEDGDIVQISSPISGFLDDYAFVIQGLLDLYESSLDCTWIEWAEILQESQNSLFWDTEKAGYFTAPLTDSTTVLRLKEDQDGAEPSGNSVSCCNLQRLGAMLDRDEWRDQAGKILSVFSTRLNRLPMALPQMASALAFYHDTPTQVYIAGRRADPETVALLKTVQTSLVPGRILALIDPDHCDPEENIICGRCESARSMRPQRGRPAAFVCRGRSCSLPVTGAEQLQHLLSDS